MLNDFAERLWIDSLIDKGEAKDPTEALVWINDLRSVPRPDTLSPGSMVNLAGQ